MSLSGAYLYYWKILLNIYYLYIGIVIFGHFLRPQHTYSTILVAFLELSKNRIYSDLAWQGLIYYSSRFSG